MEKRALNNFLLKSILALLLLFTPMFAVRAAVSFTEIMFDPAGSDSNREWVEIYNSGTSSIDISDYILQTDGTQSSHHALVPINGNAILAGGYAIIVQNVDAFKADYPGFTGLLFDSSWTGLTATIGKTLVLLDDSDVVLDQVTYNPTIGGANDGNSLQKNSEGAWVATVPTPGSATATSATSTDTGTTSGGNGTNGGSGTSATANTGKESKVVAVPQMQAIITVQKVGSAGISIPFLVNVLGYDGEKRYSGSFHTAFGDGTAHDSKGSEPFEHTYRFPGSYVVIFEYRSNSYDKKPEIATRAKIEITIPGVAISSLFADGSVVLTNNADQEADLSDWILQSGDVAYHIPSGTILLPSSKLTLPIEVTHFAVPPVSPQLLLPSGEIFMKWSDAVAEPAVAIASELVAKTNTFAATAVTYSPQMESHTENVLSDITDDTLGASAISALDDVDFSAKTKERSIWPYILAIIGVAIGSVIAFVKFGGFSESKSNMDTDIETETKKIADSITIIDE